MVHSALLNTLRINADYQVATTLNINLHLGDDNYYCNDLQCSQFGYQVKERYYGRPKYSKTKFGFVGDMERVSRYTTHSSVNITIYMK